MKTKQTLLLLAFALFASLAQAGELINESFEVDVDEIIDIDIVNGDITIVGWDENRFQIVGELSDDAEGFELERSNGITQFEEDLPDGFWRNNCFFGIGCNRNDPGARATLEFFVPINSVITFEGVNVDLNLSNLQGNIEMEIVNGPIRADNLAGSISLGTVNGSINASNLTGRVDLSTVNGTIIDSNSTGARANYSTVSGSIESNTGSARVSASSVSGGIDLELDTVDDLDASSVSGGLDVDLNLQGSGFVDLSTVSGRVILNVDPSISARFEFNTAVGGEIDNRLTEHEVVNENRFVNSSELRFSLNGGNANVEVSTVSGDIILDSR